LMVPVAITFASTFTGTKNVYGYATDNAGAASGWVTLGTWMPGSGPSNQPPTVVSVSPINGAGINQTFNAVYADSNGASDLNAVYLLFNSSLSGPGGCWIAYLRASNTMYLFNDAATGLVAGSISPGSPGSLFNSQCTISNAGAASPAGNNLTLPIAITFTGSFTGTKNVYGYATDNAGAN